MEAYDTKRVSRKDQFTGSYGDFKPRHVKSNGERYPNDVVLYEYEDPYDIIEPHETAIYVKTAEAEGIVHHPTQKPVELGRYLVRTYTNPGDIVLLISFAVAAVSWYPLYSKKENSLALKKMKTFCFTKLMQLTISKFVTMQNKRRRATSCA